MTAGLHPGEMLSACAQEHRERDCPPAPPHVKVCHLASGDAWGGAEAQIATLLRALAKRGDVKASAVVLNQGRLAEELSSAGIDVEVVPERKTSLVNIVGAVGEFVRSRRVEIIHSHRYKENLIAALLDWRNPNLRLVRTQHGWPERLCGAAGLKQYAAHALDRISARYSADRVISVSANLQTYLDPHVGPERIALIPNGIDLKQVECPLSRSEAKRRLGIREEELALGFVGRLEGVKRLDLFLAVAGELAPRWAKLKFVVAGSGREESLLQRRVCELGLANRTLLLGHRPDSYSILRALDLLLVTSDHEGLPMVLLESMWLGTPVAARAVGGIPEVLTDGKTGILLKDSDAVTIAAACTDLLARPALRQRIASAAQAVVAGQYSAERNCQRVVELYRSLVPARWEHSAAA